MSKRRSSGGNHGGGGGHDGGGMLRWLLTYADMITLLMAFFILMYSMSILNLAKFKSVAISIRSGLGGNLEGGSHLLTAPKEQTSDGPESRETPLEDFKSAEKVAHELQIYINQHNLEQSMRVTVEERGLVISVISDNMLFHIGTTEFAAGATKILDKIASIIASTSNKVMVEGHTCDLPICTHVFPSNWELSASRASRVIRLLINEYGIPAKRLAAAGYADTKPIFPNNSEENRRRNRRVDVVILTDTRL
jgi:chemotaxis protein MotB